MIQVASSLPSDASALESAISALESALTALDSKSGLWETLAWLFTGAVVIGVAIEVRVIVLEHRDALTEWSRGIVRPPDRPSHSLFIWGLVGSILVALGVAGEFGVGIKIALINGELRTKNAELRRKSDQLIALLHVETQEAQKEAGGANERASKNEKDAETERLARAKIEAAVGWRSLSEQEKRDIGAALASFSPKAGASMWFNASSTEAEIAGDIAEALRFGHITTTAPGGLMDMRQGGSWNAEIKSVDTGVVIQSTKAPAAVEFAKALIKELASRGFDAKRQTDPPFEDKPAAVIWVNVGPRPKGPQGEYKLQAERDAKAKKATSTGTAR